MNQDDAPNASSRPTSPRRRGIDHPTLLTGKFESALERVFTIPAIEPLKPCSTAFKSCSSSPLKQK